jgi:predicted Rossmann fold nucleotide-binding protein DprA/Smf involved in DNA uptake
MYVGIVGSRDYAGMQLVREYVNALQRLDPGTVVVSGGARGVDRSAETAALQAGLNVLSFRPEKQEDGRWAVVRYLIAPGLGQTVTTYPERYPRFAPAAFVRNGYIIEASTEVVAFWDGKSPGTRDSVRKASAEGKLKDVVYA